MREILRIGRQIAEGLAAAHAKGLIHRDIKPGNIWLEKKGEGEAEGETSTGGGWETGSAGEGEVRFSVTPLAQTPGPVRGGTSTFSVKILDFGLVLAQGDLAHLTQSGVIVGTPAFMSPEQASGKAVDPRSDLFSLGCVLYRLCTNQMPFKGAETFALLSALANDTPPAPQSLNPEVPARLSDLVMRLLAKKPGQRPKSALEVVKELEEIGQEKVDLDISQPATLGEGAQRKLQRKPVPWAWLAGGSVLVLGAVLALWLVFKDVSDLPPGKQAEIAAQGNENKPPQDPPQKPAMPDNKVPDAKKPPPMTEDPVDLRLVETLRGHKNNVCWVAFSGDGKTLASSADDHTIRVWDLAGSSRMPRVMAKHVHKTVICTDLRGDGLMLASSASEVVSLWRPGEVPPVAFLAASTVGLPSPAFTLGDGQALIAAHLPGRGKIIDLKAPAGVSGVAFSPDGKRLAGSCYDRNVHVWNPEAPTERPLLLRTFRGPGLTSVAWCGDNQTVFASGGDGRLFRWDLGQPETPLVFQAHKPPLDRPERARIEMVACSADGQFVASAGHDGFAKIWTRDGKHLGDLRVWNKVFCTAFSPDGKLVATASEDRLVRLWDRAEKKTAGHR